MKLDSIKLDLVKKIIDTKDPEILAYIQALFETQTDNWFEELPDDVKVSVEQGIQQADQGEGRPHAEVIEKFKSNGTSARIR
jgi:hypothetical protein